MFWNNIKIAWRSIRKHPFYAAVNLLGLFSGIAFTLLIGAYVWGELQVNRHLAHPEAQYILTTHSRDNNFGYELATFGPLSKQLKENYPSLVKNYYRFDGITSIVSKKDTHLRENIQLGDSTLLHMYGFTLLHGDARTALQQPGSMVITQRLAKKYFGKTDVVGETLNIQNLSGGNKDFAITGVLNYIQQNSVTFLSDENDNDIFISQVEMNFFGRQSMEQWNNIYIASYIETQPGVTAKDLEKPIQKLINDNSGDFARQNVTVIPVQLTRYYLTKNNAVIQRMLYTLAGTGLFILLMAVVNFINITISRSSSRLKEIGVRKVLGGIKSALIVQFLAESVLMVFIATVLALAAYPLLSNYFAGMVGKSIPALQSFPAFFILIPLAFVLLLGIAAGIYPALVMASMKSVDSLKGKLQTVKEKLLLRKSLVGFQFTVALLVLIAALVVTRQVAYFFSRQLGYNKEYIVAAQLPRDWSKAGVAKMETVRNEFATLPQVENVTLSYEIPNGNNGGAAPVYRAGTDSTAAVSAQVLITDERYLDTYQIPLKQGAFFRGQPSDSGHAILNEKAVQALGYANASEAIGSQLRIPGDPTSFTITGVVNDFHFASMQQTITPLIFFNVNFATEYRFLSFKIKPGNVNTAITSITSKWATLLPGSSFEYKFLDDALRTMYATELQLQKAAYTATALALIIVLLGLVGLVSLNIHKRTKEIGIRKVLGASVSSIMLLFFKEFAGVLLVAGAVSCPLAWYLMKGWLNGYAYRTGIGVQPFAIALSLLAAVTLVLISMQVYRAIQKNAVKSLRTE